MRLDQSGWLRAFLAILVCANLVTISNVVDAQQPYIVQPLVSKEAIRQINGSPILWPEGTPTIRTFSREEMIGVFAIPQSAIQLQQPEIISLDTSLYIWDWDSDPRIAIIPLQAILVSVMPE